VAIKTPPRFSTELAKAGTTEHALVILVVLELVALIGIRRAFHAAHGG
jgi:hypothetical protein